METRDTIQIMYESDLLETGHLNICSCPGTVRVGEHETVRGGTIPRNSRAFLSAQTAQGGTVLKEIASFRIQGRNRNGA